MKRKKAKLESEYKITVGNQDALAGRRITVHYKNRIVSVIHLSAAMGLHMRVEAYRPMFEVQVVHMPDELRPLNKREKG